MIIEPTLCMSSCITNIPASTTAQRRQLASPLLLAYTSPCTRLGQSYRSSQCVRRAVRYNDGSHSFHSTRFHGNVLANANRLHPLHPSDLTPLTYRLAHVSIAPSASILSVSCARFFELALQRRTYSRSNASLARISSSFNAAQSAPQCHSE